MSRKSQSKKTQAGLTLIEVLVVLVILVIGILTVVQLFPAGFGVMRGAQNTSAADRLAQEALENLKQNGTPDGIYAAVLDNISGTYSYVYDPTIAPADLTSTSAIAGVTAPTLPAASDVDKIRYIHNETFTVTATHTISSTSTSSNGATATSVIAPIHVLNYGPIYVQTDASGNPGGSVTVNSAPWTAVTGNSAPDMSKGYNSATNSYWPVDDPTQTLTPGAPSFMVDYNNGEIAVAPESYPQTFVFSVQIAGTSGTQSYTTQVTVAAQGNGGYNGTWFPVQTGGGITVSSALASTGWSAGTATLYRPLQYKAPGTFDADPYEFNLNEADQATGKTAINPTVGNFNVGVLAFNPALAGNQGTQAISVQASYEVYDWHVIHEDKELAVDAANPTTSGGNNTFRLAINDIKEVGDVQADGSTSTGVILGQGSTPANQYDFIFLNMDTGAMSIANNHSQVTDDDVASSTGGPIHASFRNGRLTLPMPLTDSSGAPIQHVRVFYRGTADWAVALRRAATQYRPVSWLWSATYTPPSSIKAPYFTAADSLVPGSPDAITQTPVTPNLYFYYTGTPPTGVQASDVAANTLCLPSCDVGKQIVISNVTVTVTNGSGSAASASQTIPSVQLQNLVAQKTYLQDLLTTETPISNAISALDTQLGIGANSNSSTVTITFTSVEGVSAEAVVIWRDRNVWKQHTLDTILQPV